MRGQCGSSIFTEGFSLARDLVLAGSILGTAMTSVDGASEIEADLHLKISGEGSGNDSSSG